MKILFLSLFLAFSFSGNSLAQFEHLDPLQRMIFECQMRGGCSMKKNETADEKLKAQLKECAEQFDLSKRTFLNNRTSEIGLIKDVSYFLDKPFSRVEIEKINPVKSGMIRIVRGSSRYAFETIGTGAFFPHASSTCNEVFIEKNEVIDVGNRKCRKVTMTHPEIEAKAYIQLYCEGSNKLFLSFDTKFEILPEHLKIGDDCATCR